MSQEPEAPYDKAFSRSCVDGGISEKPAEAGFGILLVPRLAGPRGAYCRPCIIFFSLYDSANSTSELTPAMATNNMKKSCRLLMA